MASTRPLILWLLEQGYQPQALQLEMQIGAADWQEAAVQEAELLQQQGDTTIHQAFLEQLRGLGCEIEPLPETSESTDDVLPTIWEEHARASSELSDELRQIVEQAIALRDQGNPDPSRELLEQQANQGVRSPWLADNLARCLVDLDRKAEALTIWQALATSPHAGVAEPAAERAAQLEAGLVQDQQKPVSVWQEHAQASSDLSDELRQILEQAIALREQGNSEESKALLELQVNLGVRSPWLAGNLARCLVNLEHKAKALEIWQALAQSSDAGVAEQAVEMAARIEAELVTNQDNALSIWEEHAKASSDLSDELRQILDQAIALREQGHPEQSLELLKQQEASSIRSPWLAGNMARCLVNLERKSEALEIWQALAQSSDAGVAEQAVDMASRIEAELVTNQDNALSIWEEHAKASSDLSDELRQILDQAIALREQGHPEQSLELLKQQEASSIRSPWLAGNMARCLVNLERKAEALEIWQTLAQSPDAGVAEQAVEMAARIEAELVTNQDNALSIWEEHAKASSDLSDELRQILDQVIALREQGHPEQSLELLKQQEASSIRSPWLAGNMARCLVNLERKAEALEIWQALAQSPDAGVAEQAVEMAARIEAELVTNQDNALSIWEEHAKASSDLSDELRQILDQAIALREQGHPEQSLELLKQQEASSIRSPWLAGNMARCLVNLERKAEALEIWQTLAQSPDIGVAEQAIKMAGQIETGLLDSLKSRLQATVESCGESLHHIQLKPDTNLESITPFILEEAVRLREAGQAQCSLNVLQTASQHGVSNDWLKDNQARALVHLDQRFDAVAIWERLTTSCISNVASTATEMVERHRPKLVSDLNRKLRQQLEREDRAVNHLPEKAPSQLEELELVLLQEAIALRQRGDSELSLQILETAQAYGLESAWIDDNRARALMELERYSQADVLWQKLIKCGIPDLEKSARKMLDLNAIRRRELEVLAKTEYIINNADDPIHSHQRAIEILADAILENPDSDALQKRLGQLAVAQNHFTDENDKLSVELLQCRQALFGHDALLTILENRIRAVSLQRSSAN